ncbi:unnamed protein product [Owenia fusiformis]|uniref:DUF7802 domain-containing protein n=1 Tax=Owenia fusiformis TaxID=6347 RepID=A0A8J1Y6I1_OWEFU|nr:unnamed protein product [Owenia fusiformis]CAH1793352.1 unnamed protein product [Owenia fusiformis]
MDHVSKLFNKKVLNWLIAFRDPRDILEKHPSFLLCEVAFITFALLTLQHALKHGGRYKYLWIGTVLHGLTVESLSYFIPDIDNFWHAQSTVMLLGKRLPLHIMCVYPAWLYTAAIAVSRLKLKSWAEPFAMGLLVVMIDLPFDIMGIKLLWWTWHDTDPNIYDRHYWVPWTSYYFHATFASSFCFIFHGTRRLFSNTNNKWESASFPVELVCTLLPGIFSMPMGCLQFIPLYHTLHDVFHIHTEVCVFILLTTYTLIVWKSDRNPSPEARSSKGIKIDGLALHIVTHYCIYMYLVLFSQPEKNVSIGLHEPLGKCGIKEPVQTVSGMVLSKDKYLCKENYDEGYYDFHCLPGGKPPKDGLDWYTVCGTPFPNHMEYICVIFFACALGLTVFYHIFFCSSAPEKPVSNGKSKKIKSN